MPKFDMGAAWDDSVVLLKSHSALTLTIAAVFFFLPTLAVSWFGPVPIEPAANATFEQVMATFQESARQAVPYQLLTAVITAIGGVGIMRLWLSRTGISVGDALVFALKMTPTMIAIQLIFGFGVGVIAVALFLPGFAAGGGAVGVLLLFIAALLFLGVCLYLWGRLAVVSPVLVDRGLVNPFGAVGEGWRLTKDNGWRIALFMFLVTLVVLIIAVMLGGLVAAVVGTGDGIGRMLTGLVEGAVAAVGGLVSAAISAAAYRQLAIRGSQDTFA
jgi:hypothetical protein